MYKLRGRHGEMKIICIKAY